MVLATENLKMPNWIVIIIMISDFLECHSKAKCRASAYSRALLRNQMVVKG